MKPFIASLLLLLLFSQNGNTQVSSFHFTDGLINNILFFEKVNDSIVCLRNTNHGIEWNVFDADLKVVKHTTVNIPPAQYMFQYQAKALNNAVAFVEQKYRNNILDVSVSILPVTGREPDTLNIIFREQVPNRFSLNAFSLSTSPDRSHLLLVRSERTRARDSLLFKIITVDNIGTLLTQQDVFVPVKQQTQMLMSILINNNGDVVFVSGDRYDSYVLGTQLNITLIESSGNIRSGEVKVPRSKLKNILITNQLKQKLQLYATYSDNADRTIDGILNTEISLSDFSNKPSLQEFSRDDKRSLGKILGAAPKLVLDEFNWHTSEVSDSSQWLLASVRNATKISNDFIQRDIPQGIQSNNTAVNGVTPSGLPTTSPNTGRRSNLATATDQIISSGYSRNITQAANFKRTGDDSLLSLRRGYREVLLALNKKKEQTFNVEQLYEKFNYTGSVFPSLSFNSAAGTKMIYTTKRKDNYELAMSTVKNGSLSEPELIERSKFIMIDERVPPVYLKNKIVFAYRNIKTGESGLMAAQ